MDEPIGSLYRYQQDSSLNIYNYGYEENFEETFHDVWENCVVESIQSIYSSVNRLILLNVVFGLLTSLELPEALFHSLSSSFGIYMLLTTVQSNTGLIVVFASVLLSYAIVKYYRFSILRGHFEQDISNLKNRIHVPVVQYALIATFLLFQHVFLEKETWLEIRGIMMIFSMKLISTVADLPLQNFPNFIQYCGYMFCGGNVLFGPWISYEHYLMQAKFPTKKNVYWLCGVIKSTLLCLFFLTVSNCWLNYLISENAVILLRSYKEALSFRAGHYFICYLSETTMLAAGWKNPNFHFDEKYWHFPITDFMSIEFPTSLALVVINWNKPMHEFLKKYVYRKWLRAGRFLAFLLTFIISSLFHGFELKVSTVLISLGIFSYLQMALRDYIAQAFDICVRVRSCNSCQHQIKRDNIVCRLCLLVFSIFSVLHLIFVGVIMDESTDQVGIYRKWQDLNFFSLWIMFINFIIIK
ncbi:protein-serine O-palmitoleoyltransferase porcupine isoform X1 [Euwallacea fornicatus]|uniref:protein-serine O-palmitoleoyltransferase porcupine isoform X1 n=2 Tax=Euwallacea fornicatus TaxID=995702 RepID=UPI00338FDD22